MYRSQNNMYAGHINYTYISSIYCGISDIKSLIIHFKYVIIEQRNF